MTSTPKILKDRHIGFLNRCLAHLPPDHESLDTSRLTILYFVVSSFDLLNSLDKMQKGRSEIIEWIYAMQIQPDGSSGSWGFRGSPVNGKNNFLDKGHLTMVFSALNTLLILGDNLSRVNREAIINGIAQYQMPDGSFCASYEEREEVDLRFVYCAASVCHILNSWSGINVERMIDYILQCEAQEGGFGQCPGNEAHGGSTFCALASLHLAGKLQELLTPEFRRKHIRWCVQRQKNGFHGRPNKDDDTCYTFWIGASLCLLNGFHLADHDKLLSFVLETQDCIRGGFAKYPDCYPDPLHTYLGISGLSLLSNHAELGLIPAACELNLSKRAVDFLRSFQADL